MKHFRNFKIATKILSGFLISVFITGIVGYVGLSNMKVMNTDALRMYEEVVEPLVQLTYIIEGVEGIQLASAEYVAAVSDEERVRGNEEIQTTMAEVEERLVVFNAFKHTEEEQHIWDEFQENWQVFKELAREVIHLAESGQKAEAHALEVGELKTEGALLSEEIHAIVDSEEHKAATLEEEIIAAYNLARLEILIFLVLGLVLTGLSASFFARIISRPIRSLERAAHDVAEGNLEIHLEAGSKDEIGSLVDSFRVMVEQIRASTEALAEEKAGIERRVEEAVQSSEAQQRYLAQSVDRMLQEMRKFADGDLTVHLQHQRDDEIGQLYRGFNRAVSNIRDLFAQVQRAVSSTVSASTQISSATEELAAGAQEQSTQASEVAAAVEEMARTIVENAQNANETATVARQNGQLAQDGGRVVTQTVEKIREIAEVVGQSAQTVERLGASSQEVGQIVKVIDEIADQTNLLALNAAIEAARAGEQGKGFAVVADEVRQLAERTTEATKQIAEMIQTIQAETDEAVQAMQRGTEEVETGIRLADEAGASLEQIVGQTQQTEDLISQIASASEEQSTTSEQISRSVEAISTVAEESARGLGDIAHSTDDLNRLMEQLQKLVAQFKVNQAGLNAGTDRPAAARQATRPAKAEGRPPGIGPLKAADHETR